MRFTLTESCKVKGARVYFKLSGAVDEAKVGLYENKDGLPGWEKNYEKFTPQEGWNNVTFSPPITFDTDFWIAVHLTWAGEGLFITADGSLNYPNRNAWDQSEWHTNPDELGGDMLIRAIVSTVSSITVTKPDGLESWERGTSYNITWTSDGVSGNVDIGLWKGGIKDIDIATVPANPALYSWAIPTSQTLGTDYKVRITSVNDSSIWDDSDSCFSIIDVGTEEEVISLPKDYRLSQVYPNPAIRKTVISYQLSAKSEVSLRIYDAVGRLVKVLANNKEKESGYYNVRWNAEGLASGIYFVKFIAGNYKVTKKLILLR